MSDRDYLYGHVCAHGSLARSCQVCDLEALLDEVQVALTWAEAPVRHDGGHLSLVERVRWLHLRGRDRHRERDEARAEVRQLRDEWTVMLEALEAARALADLDTASWEDRQGALQEFDERIARVYNVIGDDL